MNDDWKKLAAATYPDADVEKAFLDQAYAFIQNKATPLMRDPYKLGFEIVFKNDGNTKMVGIFVFRVNQELIYAPVFFLNGSVKGTDLLYRHGDKKFVCLTNEWCQYLLSLESYKEGEPMKQDLSEGTKGLNMQELIMPPGHSKGASYKDVVALNKGLPTGQEILKEFEKKSEFKKEGSFLKDFIMEDGGYNAVDIITKTASEDPIFAQALIDNVGLENAMPKELNDEIRNQEHKFNGLAFKKGYIGKAAKHGFEVIDNRKKLVKKVYKNEDSKERSGSVSDRYMRSFHNIVTLLHEDGTSSSHKVASMSGSDSDILLFSQDGWDKKRIDDLYIIKESSEEFKPTQTNELEIGSWYTERTLEEDGKEAGLREPFFVEEELESLSEGIKRFRIKRADVSSTLYDHGDREFIPCGKWSPINCASDATFKELIKGAGMEEVKVEPRGNFFVISCRKGTTPELSKVASVAYLMAELDMDESSSFDIMEKAASGRVKYYYEPIQYQEKEAGMRFNNIPEFYAGFDETFNTPSESPESVHVIADTNDPEPSNPRIGDRVKFDGPKGLESYNGDSLAQLAGENGQDSLFEHGLVGSLVNTFDSTIMIDKYMSSLEDGLDKLGRIIFLFYWKPNDFSQLYGSDDQSSLENKLVSNFKSYGDLVLELLKKTQSAVSGIAIAGNND